VVFYSSVKDIEGNLNRTIEWVKRAKERGASIVCFPELNLTGYNLSGDGDKPALKVPGEETDELARVAESLDVAILAGMRERVGSGKYYAAHAVIKPDKSVEIYRKLHVAPPESRTFGKGNRILLFDLFNIRFGIQLCYDAHFPELSTMMAEMGAEILFFPHASPRGSPEAKYESWMRHLTARAYDNSLFVVAVNQCRMNENGLNFPGVALAIDPSGFPFESFLRNREGLMVFDLKEKQLNSVRGHPMRFFLPQRRHDLFPLGQKNGEE
jgi:N-carbamoylputrescine amidase